MVQMHQIITSLLNKVPRILEKAKQHQEGRGTSLVPTGTFNFTEGYTQQEIADKIGWSRNKIAQHTSLINNVVTEVLKKAKAHQEGRVTRNVTTVTNFPKDFESGKKHQLGRGKHNSPNGELSNSTNILDVAKRHQKGRVESSSTIVERNFTEGWFRAGEPLRQQGLLFYPITSGGNSWILNRY